MKLQDDDLEEWYKCRGNIGRTFFLMRIILVKSTKGYIFLKWASIAFFILLGFAIHLGQQNNLDGMIILYVFAAINALINFIIFMVAFGNTLDSEIHLKFSECRIMFALLNKRSLVFVNKYWLTRLESSHIAFNDIYTFYKYTHESASKFKEISASELKKLGQNTLLRKEKKELKNLVKNNMEKAKPQIL